MKFWYFTISLTFLTGLVVSAQELPLTDTLAAAIKTADRRIELSIDKLSADVADIRGTLSPLGEGDPIRWAQGLPGVTTGADGGSAFYVRGGNMGNTLISLDGVPVYGFSHLLGLTTIIPVSVMQGAELEKGGYDGSENNFTAAHLCVETKAPSAKIGTSVSLNNFLLCTESDGHITNGLSYMLTARFSPLMWEYKAFRKALPAKLGSFESFKAEVGDIYGKVRCDLKENTVLELTGLGSVDEYSFSPEPFEYKSLGWRNGLASLRLNNQTANSRTTVLAYINYFDTRQVQDEIYHGVINHLTLQSEMTEASLSSDRSRSFGHLIMGYGAKGRYAEFKPGQVASINNRSVVVLADAYFQVGYRILDYLDLKAVGRINYYQRLSDGNERYDPEYSLSAKLHISPHLLLEGSFDRLVQYYHTLEGLPVGWSLDMIVPSSSQVVPEAVLQGTLGLQFRAGMHSGSVGGFYKLMDNLVYYKYSQSLFNGGLADWESQVSQGQGTSYGAEFLYEYNKDDWYARLCYTLSNTDRRGFEEVNDGKPFHARFDRTHVLNVQGMWRNLTLSLILESGHWENGAAMVYQMHTLEDTPWRAEFFSGINNYRMPTILRLDAGYRLDFSTGSAKHELNLGVCNLTNHFNPFMLFYDGKTETWKEMALLPIMPNFSWHITF